MEGNNKTYSKWSTILLLIFMAIIVVLWVFIGYKCSLLFISLFSLMMFINITTTGLCNALVGRQLPPINDVFWKTILILTTTIPLSIAIFK